MSLEDDDDSPSDSSDSDSECMLRPRGGEWSRVPRPPAQCTFQIDQVDQMWNHVRRASLGSLTSTPSNGTPRSRTDMGSITATADATNHGVEHEGDTPSATNQDHVARAHGPQNVARSVYKKSKGNTNAKKGYNAASLVVAKRDKKNVAKDIFGEERIDVMNPLEFEQTLETAITSTACSKNCENKGSCFTTIGGFAACLRFRRQVWEPVQPTTRKNQVLTNRAHVVFRTAAGGTKARHRRIRTWMHDAMEPMVMQAHVEKKRISLDKQFRMTMRTAQGNNVFVCTSFWAAVVGVSPSSTTWRNAKREVIEARLRVANGEEMYNVRLSPGKKLARPGFNTVKTDLAANWLSLNIGLYAEPLPHVKKFRLFFPNWKMCHEHYLLSFKFASPNDEAKKYLITYQWFVTTILKAPVVLDAIAKKGGFLSHEDMSTKVAKKSDFWTIECCDPRSKKEFSKCKWCCIMQTNLHSAFQKRDAVQYREVQAAMGTHHQLFMARRDVHNSNMALAHASGSQVLAIQIDGIDKRKMASPILPPHLRRSKDYKDKERFAQHCIGVIAHTKGSGIKGNRYLFFHDNFIGNTDGHEGAGMNATLTVLWCVLKHLITINQMPTSEFKRELRLQFDNCGDNKNYMVVVFAALLVRSGLFTAVHIDFLQVGHTHILIDQWFSTISHDLKTTSEDITTLPKLRDFMKKTYTCEVHNLDVLLDFKTAFDEFAAEMHGHQDAYSMRFATDETGLVKNTYQVDEDPTGHWYDFYPLKKVPTTWAWELVAMPLKPASDVLPGLTKGDDGVWTNIIYKWIAHIKDEPGFASIPEVFEQVQSMVAWWKAHFDNLSNTTWILDRESNPSYPSTDVDMQTTHVPQERPEPTMSRAKMAALGFTRPPKGNHVQSHMVGRQEARHNSSKDHWAYLQQKWAWRMRTGRVRINDLPAINHFIVFEWHENVVNAHAEDVAVIQMVSRTNFCLGKVSHRPRLGEDLTGDEHPASAWNLKVDCFMPRNVGAKYYQQPGLFARAEFAPELEDEDETMNEEESSLCRRRAASTEATTDVIPRVAEEFPSAESEDDMPIASLQAQHAKRGRAGGRADKRMIKRAKAARAKPKGRRRPKSCRLTPENVVAGPWLTCGNKWSLNRNGTLSERSNKDLRALVQWAMEHYACIRFPERCPSNLCGRVAEQVKSDFGFEDPESEDES
jgi:hypothetical protein